MLNRKILEKCTVPIAFLFLLLVNEVAGAQAMSESNFNIPVLVLDADLGAEIPKRFRTSKDQFKTADNPPSRAGMDSLQIAGSAQFSKTSLENALKKMDGPVFIVDLRKESHGFIDGVPISWYSKGNQSNASESDDNLIRQEQMLINDVRRQGSMLVSQILQKKDGIITKTRPIDMKVKNAQTESSLANHLNLGYIRLGVLDHNRPSDHTVDTFVDFVKTLPSETWLYFHCRGGKGRSTTFMVMYDMIKNGKKVSMEDIIKRQVLIGGTDLFLVSDDEDDAWKKDDIIERKKFITRFYQYATDSRGLGKKSWSEWNTKNKR